MNPNSAKDDFLSLVQSAIASDEFIAIKLSKPTDPSLISASISQYEGESRISCVYTSRTQTITKHYSTAELLNILARDVGDAYMSATLFSSTSDFGLDYNRRGAPSLQKRKPTKIKERIKHNRDKSYLIPEDAPFLKALDIAGPQGIRSAMSHKFRQINKFVELFSASLAKMAHFQDRPLKVCDLGAGKSYLTFAIEYHLTINLKIPVEIIAIEHRAELVDKCTAVAQQIGSSIKFIAGEIADLPINPDILVALHACDTATDDAIVAGVKSGASLLLLAPCCQRWLRNNHELLRANQAFLRDGIIAERHLAMLTDLVRAAILENLGYECRLFEFIGSEDTDKNIMLSAVRTGKVGKAERLKEIEGVVDYKRYYLAHKLAEIGHES